MSDFFKKIGDTLSETGKTVGEKTKQVGNAAKLNARIISAERSVSENYTIIGKYYYDKYKNEPEEEIAETVNAVTASLEAIESCKNQLLTLKGLVKCQNCGNECPAGNAFCGKCGAAIEKPEPVPEDTDVEETEELPDSEASEEAPADAAEEKTEE